MIYILMNRYKFISNIVSRENLKCPFIIIIFSQIF